MGYSETREVVQLTLVRNGWDYSDSVFANGTAFDADGNRVDLINEFEGKSVATVKDRLKNLSGFFSAIILRDDSVHLITDRVRSIPLYYRSDGNQIIVSDSSESLGVIPSKEDFSDVVTAQYLLTGYVWGEKTLADGVSQTLPGQIISFDPSKEQPITSERYYRYPDSAQASQSSRDSEPELEERLHTSFERLIEYAGGRPIAVSLSGGYDSRLCLLMLKELGYQNLLAFTFGRPESTDVTQAREAATQLGVELEFIEFSHNDWYEWYRTEERKQLDSYLGRLGAIPNIDSAMAYQKGSKNGQIPDNAVVVQGDAVFTTGEHIPRDFIDNPKIGCDELYRKLLEVHHRWDSRLEISRFIHDNLKNSLLSSVGPNSQPIDTAVAAAEHFDWQERQPKFINRCGVIDFYDFDWWLPLWDDALLDIWATTDAKKKLNKSMMKNYTINKYASMTGISKSAAIDSVHGNSSVDATQQVMRAVRELTEKTTITEKISKYIYFKYVGRPPDHSSDPRLGIMSEEFFNNIQLSDKFYHGYRILDWLGYLSIEDKIIYSWPDHVYVSRWSS